MRYPDKLLYYFHQRAHAGRLEPAIEVSRVQVGNPENQQILVLYVAYRDQILQAKFQATGSVALIAGGEFICGWLESKTWEQIMELTPQWVLQELGLSAVHIHVAQLIIMAVKQLADSGTLSLECH